jgi:uncharacterized circularly permuted ATP-grasp superfamily protein
VVEPEDEERGPGIDKIREAVAERPEDYVAQERVSLSTHPTVGDAGFEPRRVDLRPFLLRTATGWQGIPGGLTRFAPTADSLVVNSTMGGGGKDSWVLA